MSLYNKLEFEIATKDAKKLIEESTIVVFPDRSPVNIAKCYLDISEKYKKLLESQKYNDYKWIEKDLESIQNIKQKKRREKHLKQYQKNGWSDVDTWDMDFKFVKWIVPRLKRFIEVNNGYPDRLGFTEKSWDKTLKEMLEGFELMASPDYWDNAGPKEEKKIDKSFELFGKYGRALTW